MIGCFLFRLLSMAATWTRQYREAYEKNMATDPSPGSNGYQTGNQACIDTLLSCTRSDPSAARLASYGYCSASGLRATQDYIMLVDKIGQHLAMAQLPGRYVTVT